MINIDIIVHVIMWVVAIVLIFIASVNLSVRFLMPRERKVKFDVEEDVKNEPEREV